VDSTYTPEEQRLIDVWEEHLRCEFADRDAASTVATMSDDNYVNHVPVMTGGHGRDEMLTFYGRHFIPRMPADTRLTPVCCLGWRRPAVGSRFRWWSSFSCVPDRSCVSGSTGIRRRSWCNSGCSTRRTCRSPGPIPPERYWIPGSRPTI